MLASSSSIKIIDTAINNGCVVEEEESDEQTLLPMIMNKMIEDKRLVSRGVGHRTMVYNQLAAFSGQMIRSSKKQIRQANPNDFP